MSLALSMHGVPPEDPSNPSKPFKTRSLPVRLDGSEFDLMDAFEWPNPGK